MLEGIDTAHLLICEISPNFSVLGKLLAITYKFFTSKTELFQISNSLKFLITNLVSPKPKTQDPRPILIDLARFLQLLHIANQLQFVNNFMDIAIHDVSKVIQCQSDSVVGDTALGIIVSSDFCRTVA